MNRVINARKIPPKEGIAMGTLGGVALKMSTEATHRSKDLLPSFLC
jgi:hypothetical protein